MTRQTLLAATEQASPGRVPAASTLELARGLIGDPIMWLLFGLGLALRVVVGLMIGDHALVSDEAEYVAAARVFADGRGFTFYDTAPWLRPPAYIMFLGTLMRLAGPEPLVAQVVQVGASLTIGWLAGWLAWLAGGGRAVARLAAGLSFLALPLAVLPWLLLTETWFTVALLLALVGLLARLRGGHWAWLVVMGVSLGAACLLRGIGLGYAVVVVLAVSLLARPWRRLRDALVVLGIMAALIAPWAARNAVTYRALVPLETTAAYNLWLRAQSGRGESWMLGELREQPDVAARQAWAWQRGLALVVANPAAYLSRGWWELGDLVRLNVGADERFMSGYASGEVSRGWLALSLLLDDLFLVLLLPLATLGLAVRAGPLRWVTLGWLGWTAALAFVFFAITRFRVPLLPLLAIYAAVALVEWRAIVGALRAGRPSAWAGAVVGLVALALVGASFNGRVYRDGWAARDAWEVAQRAEQQRQAGDPAGALAMLDQAAAANSHVAFVRGLSLAALGQRDAAEAVLAPHRGDARALVALGEVRRLTADAAGAQRYWSTREVDLANPLAWSWRRVNVPGAGVAVGDGSDLGLVRGMHGEERDGPRAYRWTDGQGAMRLTPARAGRQQLVATLRSLRPNDTPVVVQVRVAGRPLTTWSVGGAWQEYSAPLDIGGDVAEGEVTVELISDAFVPGYLEPRALGVMVDSVALRPAGQAWEPASMQEERR